MNTQAFTEAMSKSRNGSDGMTRHPLVHDFIMSDGVIECAEAGCWWLMDILATELPRLFGNHTSCSITVKVADSKAVIEGEFQDGVIGYTRSIDWTDLPDGDWLFYVGFDGEFYACILLSEY